MSAHFSANGATLPSYVPNGHSVSNKNENAKDMKMRKIEPNMGSNTRGINVQNGFGRSKTNQRSRSLAGQFGP